MNTREQVAAEVRAALGRANMTPTTLASNITLSRAGLSERLNSHRPFNTDQLAEIGAVLGVDPIDFLVAGPAAERAVAS